MHFRFTNEFLGECNRVLTWKLDTVKKSSEESRRSLRKLKEDLEKLEDERKMVNIRFLHKYCTQDLFGNENI